jgi:uncharacterized protein
MTYIFIGLVVGLIMGLTGAGGALISIPLFLTLLKTTLKEATVLSLIAVMLGTIVNLFNQKHPFDKKIVLGFVVFGAIANYASLPLKEMVPNIVVAILLSMIAIFSLWSVWKASVINETHTSVNFFKIAVTGLFLGLITTLTGLGGGVLLVPILINFFGKNYEEAMPTSLLTILLIALIAFLFQMEVGLQLISIIELALIAIGAVAASFTLKFALKKLDKTKTEKVRKVIFSLVIIYAIVSVIIKSF